MDSEELKVRGVVREVGIERDESRFDSFNLKIGVVVKSGKSLSYEAGEQLMRQFRKELLGKEVKIAPIVVLCPVCGKGFKSEQGMKQHMRMIHEKKAKKRKAAPRKKPKKASKPGKKAGRS